MEIYDFKNRIRFEVMNFHFLFLGGINVCVFF